MLVSEHTLYHWSAVRKEYIHEHKQLCLRSKPVLILNSGNFQRTTHPDAQWFGQAGLGLFIHWGISSVNGGINLSWGMIAEKPWDPGNKHVITPEEYYQLADCFKPDKYAPDK